MTVWLVLTTPLRFVEIFSAPPVFDPVQGWGPTDVFIEKLDPASVELLRFERLLWPGRPQAFDLVLDGESRWHVLRWGRANFVSVLRDMQIKVTHCWRSAAALHLHQFPLGLPIALVPQPQRSSDMPHPKTEKFKKEFEEKFGKKDKKEKKADSGSIPVAKFKEFAKKLIKDSRSCTPEELPALVNDLETGLDTIAETLAE